MKRETGQPAWHLGLSPETACNGGGAPRLDRQLADTKAELMEAQRLLRQVMTDDSVDHALRRLRGAIRDEAVSQVDARHGYTIEFSHSPERHATEYDKREAKLLRRAISELRRP